MFVGAHPYGLAGTSYWLEALKAEANAVIME